MMSFFFYKAGNKQTQPLKERHNFFVNQMDPSVKHEAKNMQIHLHFSPTDNASLLRINLNTYTTQIK